MLLNILVTGCGGDIGQSIGKILLKWHKVKNLYGMDISNRNAARFIYPNFKVGLPVSHPAYLQTLEKFVADFDIDIVIPVSEVELRFFSNEKIFSIAGRAKLITASYRAMEVGFDKYKTFEFLKYANLPFPKTALAVDMNGIDRFPVILKSRLGSGSKNIYRINSIKDFYRYTEYQTEKYLIQEYITDKKGEFTCGLYRGRNREVRFQIFKRELVGGFSGYGELVNNDTIGSLLIEIASKLDLIGSINVQLRMDGNTPKVFEINPRFSSTVLFRHLFGFEDLIWSINDLMGEEIGAYSPPIAGGKFYKGYQEYILSGN